MLRNTNKDTVAQKLKAHIKQYEELPYEQTVLDIRMLKVSKEMLGNIRISTTKTIIDFLTLKSKIGSFAWKEQ